MLKGQGFSCQCMRALASLALTMALPLGMIHAQTFSSRSSGQGFVGVTRSPRRPCRIGQIVIFTARTMCLCERGTGRVVPFQQLGHDYLKACRSSRFSLAKTFGKTAVS